MKTRFLSSSSFKCLILAFSENEASTLLLSSLKANPSNWSSSERKPIALREIEDDLSDPKDDVWSMVASFHHSDGDSSPTAYKHEGDVKDIGKLDWSIKLDQHEKYELQWRVEYQANEIIFALVVDEKQSNFRVGYDLFALGFSSRGELKSSDFCLIWYDLSHKIHVQDAKIDSDNKLRLVEATDSICSSVETSQKTKEMKEDNQFRITFKRPLDACQSAGSYYTIDNGTTHLVWFTMKGPLLSIDGLDMKVLIDESEVAGETKQLVHGMRRVQLIATKQHVKYPSRLHHDIKMENFKIPAKQTTYWCKLFKLPEKFEAREYHITKYEAIIEKANEHVVHHMELFNCANTNTNGQELELELSKLYESGGWSGDCNGIHRPKATVICRKVVLAWAMGAQPLVYPDQVGQLIGGQAYSPFLVLEVHYNNIESISGLVDNSGLRFHYTSRLRPFDAGILEVGLEYTDKISIPPKMVTPIAGYCVSECTRVGFLGDQLKEKNISYRRSQSDLSSSYDSPVEGINIFAGQMHTHLTGVASWTEHIREGRLLGEIQRDDHYSAHFQEIRLLPEVVHVAPGDALIHYCLYDTRNRENITLGGYGTNDEMCVTYLHYYPRQELEVCKSSVETQALEAYFSRLARDENQATTTDWLNKTNKQNSQQTSRDYHRKSVSENYQSIEWSPRRSRELIRFYSKSPLSVQCDRSNGQQFPGHWNGIEPTKIWPPEISSDDYNSGEHLDIESREQRLDRDRGELCYRGLGAGHRHAHCESRLSRNNSRAN